MKNGLRETSVQHHCWCLSLTGVQLEPKYIWQPAEQTPCISELRCERENPTDATLQNNSSSKKTTQRRTRAHKTLQWRTHAAECMCRSAMHFKVQCIVFKRINKSFSSCLLHSFADDSLPQLYTHKASAKILNPLSLSDPTQTLHIVYAIYESIKGIFFEKSAAIETVSMVSAVFFPFLCCRCTSRTIQFMEHGQ